MKQDRTIPSGLDWLDAVTYGAGWLTLRAITLGRFPNWQSPSASVVKGAGIAVLVAAWMAVVAYNWWLR